MSSTFLRVLAAVVYRHIVHITPNLVHPSQALLNHFREPQGNFLDMRNLLRPPKDAAHEQKGGVLVTDFMKAFEVINPHFIVEVLKARGAPAWLIAYVHFVLVGRSGIPKIHGKLLPGLAVQVGVDMGDAMSPLLSALLLMS